MNKKQQTFMDQFNTRLNAGVLASSRRLVQLVRKQNMAMDRIRDAALAGHLNTVKFLLAEGTRPYGMQELIAEVLRNGHTEVARCLSDVQ